MAHPQKPHKLAIWLLVISNVLLPIALLTFATGFFPYKPFIQGTNHFTIADQQTRPDAPFDKVIFMVVDALRSDFVYSDNSGFAFVQSLIRSGEAIPFTGHATSPTITMPRVKALTTGSIPSFLDVILNFAESDTTSTLANQDTWPLQLSLKEGGQVNMFGDDTWVKLFPNLFTRMDGTTSFFVSDFTEVDNNVTRNVPGELAQSDWNGMILHYLGLDHIGHKSGPSSPNMIPKQQEMDGIVQTIFESMSSSPDLSNTLLVLAGDHGMNEAGNHGGSAPGETSPALVFISTKLKQIPQNLTSPAPLPKDEFQYYTVVEQSDVVPTLAGLLGFPIPLNNLGVFIPSFLDFWPSAQDKHWLLHANIKQMMGIVKPAYASIAFDDPPRGDECVHPDTDEAHLHCGYHNTKQLFANVLEEETGTEHVYKFLRDVQSIMSSVSSNYNMSLLIQGVVYGVVAYLSVVASLVLAINAGWISAIKARTLIWILVVQFAYGAMMFASSYVEEEQHFWYWILSAWLLWLFFTRYRSKHLLPSLAMALALGISRFVRRWNQTGQKFSGEPDIAKTFLRAHNQLLWILAIGAYFYYFVRACKRSNSSGMWLANILLNLYTLVAGVAFKIAFTHADAPELLEGVAAVEMARDYIVDIPLSSLARYVFSGVFTTVLVSTFMTPSSKIGLRLHSAAYFHTTCTFLLLTQTRLNNIPLLILFSLQLEAVQYISLSIPELTLTIFLFQHASYFAYGGSNAISSIDLSNAYNGVTGYNAVAVGFLTFISNWTGPVWWSLGGVVLLVRHSPNDLWNVYYKHTAILTMMVATSLVFVQIACLMLRMHLFIWTVFSPKYLYMMAWTLGQHVGVNVLLSAAMVWIVR